MRFYHYTSRWALERILRDQKIKTTDGNIRADGSGPRVVWLTTGEAEQPWLGGATDKSEIRIVIELSPHAVEPWVKWSRANGIKGDWYRRMTAGCTPEQWRVATGPIPASKWVQIERRTEQGYVRVADPSLLAGDPEVDELIRTGRAASLPPGQVDPTRWEVA